MNVDEHLAITVIETNFISFREKWPLGNASTDKNYLKELHSFHGSLNICFRGHLNESNNTPGWTKYGSALFNKNCLCMSLIGLIGSFVVPSFHQKKIQGS